MVIELLTKDDLVKLKEEIITELKEYIKPKEEDNWLKSSEVKELLRCSDGTLQKHRISGRLPYTKYGSTYYYSKVDLQNLMKKNLLQFGIA